MLEILLGIGLKLLAAFGGAEIVSPPLVSAAMFGGMRVHPHAANRVLDALVRISVRAALRVRVHFMSSHGEVNLSLITLLGYLLTRIPMRGIGQAW